MKLRAITTVYLLHGMESVGKDSLLYWTQISRYSRNKVECDLFVGFSQNFVEKNSFGAVGMSSEILGSTELLRT